MRSRHVGVLCVEMFERAGERPELIVNEFAPRVHNSGHWTLDACLVSQFENHIRAICGWPLGETARHSDAVMTNLIGADVERWRELAAEPDTAVHLYGKAEARPGPQDGPRHPALSKELSSHLDNRQPFCYSNGRMRDPDRFRSGLYLASRSTPKTNGQTESKTRCKSSFAITMSIRPSGP